MKEIYDNDAEKVSAFLEEFFQDEQKYKNTWAQQARTWVAFSNGDQNPFPMAAPIMVNNNPALYNTQTDPRQNIYQGDELEAINRTLVSYMTRTKPTVNCLPVSEDEDSKHIARTAERVLDAKYVIDEEARRSREAAALVLSMGTVFGKDYWDYSAGQYHEVTDESGQPVLDESGQPKLSKTGNNSVAILTPLTISVDHSVTDWDMQPLVGESYIMDVEWAREVYDRDEPGYTGMASKIAEDGAVGSTIRMHEDMKFAIPYVSWGSGSFTKSQGKCLVQEWNLRPNRTYPHGRLLVKAGGAVVYDSANRGQDLGNPYFQEEEEWIWHPYTCLKYEDFLGRFLGKSLIEGLIPLQMRLNEINGSILENANTLAKPNIIAAIGQLKKGITNGRGANIYTYAVIPGAEKPSGFNGIPLPEQFFKERQQIIDNMVRKAGTNFVMQGQAPTGVTAASAIQQLLENANTQQSALMQAWENFHEQRFTKKLRNIHKFMKYPDKNLTKYLKKLCKDALDEQIDDFVGCNDLSAGVSVTVVAGSTIPKSKITQAQTYMELAKEGALGPSVTADGPVGEKVRAQLLEKIGLEPLESEESVELKKAKWENDRCLKGLPVEVSPYDNPAIHIPCHISKIQDPKFLETATDEQKLALDTHIQEHQMIEAQKAQEAQMQQMMMADQQHAQAMELKGAGKSSPVPEMSGMEEGVPTDPGGLADMPMQ